MDNTSSVKGKNSSKKYGWAALTALVLLFGAACAAAAIAALIYFGASVDAFHSAMIGLLLFGAALLLSGICVFLVSIAVKILRRHLLTSDKYAHSATKKSDLQLRLEKIFSFSNVALALLAVGAVLIFASAGLGCTKRDNWTSAMRDYRAANGYCPDGTVKQQLKYDVGKEGGGNYNDPTFYLTESDPLVVELHLTDMRAVIVFDKDADPGFVQIMSYNNYEKQIVVANMGGKGSDSGVVNPEGDNRLVITQTPRPKHYDATSRLILGLSDSVHGNAVGSTVVITLNEIYRGLVVVEGGPCEIV